MSGILKVGGSELINDNGGSGSLQWGSGVPSGSVIRTLIYNSSEAVDNETAQFIPLNSTDTSIQIPNFTIGNKLVFWITIHTKIREGTTFYIALASYYRSHSGSRSSPSQSSPWVLNQNNLALFDTVVSTTEVHSTSSTLIDVIEGASDSGTTNIDYGIYATFGSDPSEIRDYKRYIIVQEIKG